MQSNIYNKKNSRQNKQQNVTYNPEKKHPIKTCQKSQILEIAYMDF